MEKEIQQLLKRAGMLTEIVSHEENRYGEQVAVANDLPFEPAMKSYPELDELAIKIAQECSETINKQVQLLPSDMHMPYKVQYVLEEVIKALQEAV